MKFKTIISLLVILTIAISCDETYTPKPRGYIRIELPERSYISLDSTFPYKFEYPSYAKLSTPKEAINQPYMLNIDIPRYKATLFLTYKAVNGNIATYLEDNHVFLSRHISKASAIDESVVASEEHDVWGAIYTISGSGAASPLQFFVTDSSANFLRGALYFNVVPNNDSLAPVIEFLQKDIAHLIETLQWKK
ncbi:MAG TPA: gliding motility lipoprotein GldD [Bacteroidales bacterium]|jgi:gliding motility-associated lipoprotein GldD|nr:gliding motility lipoprotein GldD [Bacteroidales bacterium]